jgi:general secretion pathway protein A
MICQEFSIAIPSKTKTKREYLEILYGFLLEKYQAGKNTVLIIDEAQKLSHHLLEELRLLSNLETDKEKLLQIVLLGQEELNAMIRMYSLRQINQRITVRYHLKHLSRYEVPLYIQHRLTIAGLPPGEDFFTPAAYRLVYKYTGGNPRLINALCDRAFLIAYTFDRREISRRIVKEAAGDLGEAYLNPFIWGRHRKMRLLRRMMERV